MNRQAPKAALGFPNRRRKGDVFTSPIHPRPQGIPDLGPAPHFTPSCAASRTSLQLHGSRIHAEPRRVLDRPPTVRHRRTVGEIRHHGAFSRRCIQHSPLEWSPGPHGPRRAGRPWRNELFHAPRRSRIPHPRSAQHGADGRSWHVVSLHLLGTTGPASPRAVANGGPTSLTSLHVRSGSSPCPCHGRDAGVRGGRRPWRALQPTRRSFSRS